MSIHKIALLPFQSYERYPGKSSHISPLVQMAERPKYALFTGKKVIVLRKKNIQKLSRYLKKTLTCVVHGV